MFQANDDDNIILLLVFQLKTTFNNSSISGGDYLLKVKNKGNRLTNSQLTFTCSKPIIETLQKGVKYVKS